MKPLKIFFLHGFMGSPLEANFLRKLSPYKIEIKAPHLVNICHDTAIEELQKQFISYNPDLLYGYSMGGRLALRLINQAVPTQLKYVVLESSALTNLNEHDSLKRVKDDEQRAKEIRSDYKTFLEKWYELPLWGNISQEQKKDLINTRYNQNIDHLQQLSSQIEFIGPGQFHLPDIRDWPRSLNYLYLCGEEDKKYSQMIKDFCSHNLCFTSQSCPRAGHNLHLQRPEFITDTLLNWVSP